MDVDLKRKEFRIQKWPKRTEKRKIGLDSCVLIELIDRPEFFNNKAADIFKEKNLIFTHRLCVKETVNWLVKKRGELPEEAEEKVKEFLSEKNISVTRRRASKAEVKALYEECERNDVRIHPPDSFIIADFAKAGINTCYSINNHFVDVCRVAEIDGIKFPTFEREIKEKFKELFGAQ